MEDHVRLGCVPAAAYNSLPLIQDVANAPHEKLADLEELQRLLAKHHLQGTVYIRLLHKHFDVEVGEIMVVENVVLASHGTVEIMRPIVPMSSAQFCGLHYFVTADGHLQAYEYTPDTVVDISEYGPFIKEFVSLVLDRNLERTFGLKLGRSGTHTDTEKKEFELPGRRSTITLPTTMPSPNGNFKNINTEWGVLAGELRNLRAPSKPGCSHRVQEKYKTTLEDVHNVYLDEELIEQGTPFGVLIADIGDAW